MNTKTREKSSVAKAILATHAAAAQSALNNVEAMMKREAQTSAGTAMPEGPRALRQINRLIQRFEEAEANLGAAASEDDPRMQAMDKALNELFDFQPSTIEAVHRKVQFLIDYDQGRLVGYTEDNTCLSSLLRSLIDRPRGFSGRRPNPATGEVHYIIDDYDLGPVSQRALDLIAAHFAAEQCLRDAAGAEDKDEDLTPAEKAEIRHARRDVYSTAIDIVAFRGETNADRMAICEAAEATDNESLGHMIDLPYALRDAMAAGFRQVTAGQVNYEAQSSKAEDLIAHHQAALARLATAADRDTGIGTSDPVLQAEIRESMRAEFIAAVKVAAATLDARPHDELEKLRLHEQAVSDNRYSESLSEVWGLPREAIGVLAKWYRGDLVERATAASSHIDTLIADYVAKRVECEQNHAAYCAIDENFVQPEHRVQVGVRDRGASNERPVYARTEEEIRNHYNPGIHFFQNVEAERAKIEARRDEKIAELNQIRAERDRLYKEAGLEDLEAAGDRLLDEADAIYDRLLEAKPASLDEAARKIQAIKPRFITLIEGMPSADQAVMMDLLIAGGPHPGHE